MHFAYSVLLVQYIEKMPQIHYEIEIQCKMKLKYDRDRILSLQIFLTLIGISSHQLFICLF
jgi:hypothetical protein